MDLAFEAVGGFGKFQKIVTFLVLSVGSMALITSISFPFLTMQPNFLCREKSNIFDSFHTCHSEDLCNPEHFDYKKDPKTSLNNISYEFDTYCERGFYVNLIGSGYFFGGIFGSVFLSSIPDRYGRATIYKILLLTLFVLMLNLFLSVSVQHFAIINFLTGFSSYSMSMCTLILTEYLPRNYVGIIMSLHSATFPLSGIAVAIFFIYINNWRVLLGFCTVYTALMAYLVIVYFKESPRWLNAKNRVKESLDSLKEIAAINGNSKTFETFMEQNSNLIKSSDNVEEVKKTLNLFEIFELRSQKLNIMRLTYVWFASGFCFYGLILNLEHLGGNIFLNSIVTFIGESFSEILSGFLADEFGRIIVLKVTGVIGGVSFILYEMIDESHWYRSVFIFLTSFGFSGTFNLIYLYSPEVFPTSIRSTVIGFLYFISRMGACLVPSITPHVPHSPFLFGILSIVSGYICSFLPETLGKEIPDDVPESQRKTSFLSTTSRKRTSNNALDKFSGGRRTIVSDMYFKISEF
jgi:MFS transporter, OCT family, solute carrier family 22 (organic cation transporter), member 4/5